MHPLSICITYLPSETSDLARQLKDALHGIGLPVRLRPLETTQPPGLRASFSDGEIVVPILDRAGVASTAYRERLSDALQSSANVFPVLTEALLPIPLSLAHLTSFLIGPEIDPQTLSPLVKHLSTLEGERHFSVPLASLRPLPEPWCDRTAWIQQVRDGILDHRGATIRLLGPPGSGKSAVIRALCDDPELLEAFPGRIVWLPPSFAPVPPLLLIREVGASLGARALSLAGHLDEAVLLLGVLCARAPVLCLFDTPPSRAVVRVLDKVNHLTLLLPDRSGPEAPLQHGEGPVFILPLLPPEVVIPLLGAPAEGDSLPAAVQIREGLTPLTLRLVLGALKEGLPADTLAEALIEDESESGVLDVMAEQLLSRLKKTETRRLLTLSVFPPDTPLPEAPIRRLWDALKGVRPLKSIRPALDRLVNAGWLRRGPDDTVYIDRAIHEWLVRRFEDEAAGTTRTFLDTYNPEGLLWSLTDDDGYLHAHLAYHLHRAGLRDALCALLLDPLWIETRLERAGPPALLRDYLYAPFDAAPRLVGEALALASPILADAPRQLASQLQARLLNQDHPDIQRFLDRVNPDVELAPTRLHPLSESLSGPGRALLRRLTGHIGAVRCVALLPTGTFLVSAGDDYTVRVWHFDSGQEVRTLYGHRDRIRFLIPLANARHLLSGGDDGTIILWDLLTGEALLKVTGMEAPITALTVSGNNTRALAATEDGILWLIDLANGGVLQTVLTDGQPVWTAALDHEGARAFTAAPDGSVLVWDMDSGAVVRALTGHEDRVWDLVVPPDGTTLVTASEDATLRIWDLDRGTPDTLHGHEGGVRLLAMRPDGRHVLSASDDGTLRVWNLENGEPHLVLAGIQDWICSAALSPDGRYAVTASGTEVIKVWDAVPGARKRVLAGHDQVVRSILPAPYGPYVYTGSDDNTIKLWDLNCFSVDHTLTGHTDWITALAVTSDAHHLISASFDHTLRVWDLEERTLLHTLEGHTDWVGSVATLPNLHLVLSASEDRTVRMWSVEDGTCLNVFTGHEDRITSMAVSRDGDIAITGSDDRTVGVWDLEADRLVTRLSLHETGVRQVRLAQIARLAVSVDEQGTVYVWNVSQQDLLHTFKDLKAPVRALEVATVDPLAVTGDEEGTLTVWNLETGDALRTIAAHRLGIRALALSADGRSVASLSYDQSVKLWDVGSGALIGQFTGDSPMVAGVFSRDDRILIVGDADGGMHFLEVRGR